MTATADGSGGVVVVYTYTYGCKNTFTLTLTEGDDTMPGQVTSNECSYSASWRGLGKADTCAAYLGAPVCDSTCLCVLPPPPCLLPGLTLTCPRPPALRRARTAG